MTDETIRREREDLNTSDLASIGENPHKEAPLITPPPTGRAVGAGPGAAATARARERVPENGSKDSGPLFSANETENLRKQWEEVQSGFVDEPRQSVEQADQLVVSTMKRLAEIFAAERRKLEGQWESGDKVSTEDLRVALQRYRSFFGRLLAV